MKKNYAVILMLLTTLPLVGLSQLSAVPTHRDTMVHTVFYGHIPTLPTDVKAATIAVVALNDATKVTIYDIAEPKVLTEKTVNRFGVVELNVTKETYFKIIADKPIAAAIAGIEFKPSPGYPYHIADPQVPIEYPPDPWGAGMTVYPSITGSPIGTEFILYALHPINTVYALEPATVNVYDASGALVDSFKMPGNWANPLLLTRRHVYRVVTTGKVMIARWPQGYGAATVLPDLETGDLVGKSFIGRPGPSTVVEWGKPHTTPLHHFPAPIGAYAIFAYEPATVSVYDLVSGELLATHKLNKSGEYIYNGGTVRTTGEGGSLKIVEYIGGAPLKDLKFSSTGLVSIWIGACHQTSVYESNLDITGLGDDIWFAGGLEGKDFVFYAPSYAIVFAPQDVRIRIDDTERTVKADSYVRISAGFHRVVSDKVIIVQVVGMGDGMTTWSQYLVSSPDIPATRPTLLEAGNLMLIGGAATVVVVAAVIVFLRMKRKRASSS
jgi:hypothetical protein